MAERIRIVALGDSTTAGTPGFLSPLEAPPGGKGDITSQYAHWLMKSEPTWDVINCGVNGERSDQIAARVVRDVIGASPSAVVIIAGVNDVYQGRTVEHVLAQLRTMYDRAAHAGIRVVGGTIVPYNTAGPAENERMRQINAWIREQTRNEPAIAFVDTRAAVAAPGNIDHLAESPDGLHPSPGGYRAMADAIRPVLQGALRGIL
jgi:lysophospholipase L1-like esterase